MFQTYGDIYILRRWLVVIGISIDCLISGAGTAFSGTLIPDLENSPLGLTEFQGSLVASGPSLGMLFGAAAAIFSILYFGHKWTYVLAAFTNCAAWSLIGFGMTKWDIYIGRIIQGVALGLGYPLQFSFITAIETKNNRATLLNISNFGSTSGMLFVDVLGTYYFWRLSAYILAGLSLVYLLIFLYLRDPYERYLDQKRIESAKQAYYWYRNNASQIDLQEFEDLINLAEQSDTFWAECKRREFLRPLAIMLWFYSFAVLTGGTGISLYSVQIMQRITAMNAYVTTIVIDILRLSSCALTNILLNYLSRRSCTNSGAILGALALFLLICSLFWETSWGGWQWFALIAILIFHITYYLVYINICNIMTGEVFIGITKTFGAATCAMLQSLIAFGYSLVIPVMLDNFGTIKTFSVFAGWNILGVVGLYLFLPETKDMSSVQIRTYFAQSKSLFTFK